MGPEITFVLLAIGLAISGAMVWLERRPQKSLDVRMIPTTPILMGGILISLIACIHLLGMLSRH